MAALDSSGRLFLLRDRKLVSSFMFFDWLMYLTSMVDRELKGALVTCF